MCSSDLLLDLFIGYYGQSPKDHWLIKKIKQDDKDNLIPNQLLEKLSPFFAFEAPYVTLDGKNAVPNQLFHNEGNGKFKNVSNKLKVNTQSWSLASLAYDYNQDGYSDLHVVNDFAEDELFLYNKAGYFEESASKIGLDDRGAGMNISVTDYNHDGYFDSYITVVDMFSKHI